MSNEEEKSFALPREFVDSHHHFLNTASNSFQKFLGALVPDESYLPENYEKDVVQKLKEKGTQVVGSVHVECMPDDGVQEAEWIHQLSNKSTVGAIVASCDLASADCASQLQKLASISSVRGIRWILDCIGKFEPGTATHVATTRHDGVDYLRGNAGAYNGTAVPQFEKGFSRLEQHSLSFDLQCAPVQLPAAAALFRKYPNIPICIDHLGKPRSVLGPDYPSSTNTVPDSNEINSWHQGMKTMAALPHVYVKISMLGYAVPGWIRSPERIAVVRRLVRETVELFAPCRCMVALNWWKSGPLSDSDGLSSVGPDAVEYLRLVNSFLDGYSDEDKRWIFCETAKKFYRM